MALMANEALRRRSDFPGVASELSSGACEAERMLAWLQEQAESGVVTISFEFEGGLHVTVDPISAADPTRAARNVSTLKEGIAQLMAESRDGH